MYYNRTDILQQLSKMNQENNTHNKRVQHQFWLILCIPCTYCEFQNESHNEARYHNS